MTKIVFKDWKFEVDKNLTEYNYENLKFGGADSCDCKDCKNYVQYRENIFPEEVKLLFNSLGIDYKKDVEILSYESLPNDLHHVGGWFVFIGKMLSGNDCSKCLPSGGSTLDLFELTSNFSIGFTNKISYSYFEKNLDLVQVEFQTNIPWVISENRN